MGIFKQMKDLKDMATAAPEMMGQAQRMAEQAQQMSAQAAAQQQAAQQAAQQQAPAQAAPPAVASESIAGVDLALYATIVKAIAPLGYDQSLLPGLAAANGVAPAAWQEAHEGWNARIQAEPEVARAFSDLYRA